eukprot:TRINITY_DN9782_c0_g1_i3.p1 TRINITY_DN9782_c0_g1~~TRINITY_DN9782_c0_g1_i3.p1  ORF type:complete len:339 (+),score=21.43 TRINITY_DN9782_c0_g1_i3:302-1318(+)
MGSSCGAERRVNLTAGVADLGPQSRLPPVTAQRRQSESSLQQRRQSDASLKRKAADARVGAATASKKERIGAEPGVRLIMWDFDRTLSAIHVFKTLSGWSGSLPEPHARSERGQLRRIRELNQKHWVYDEEADEVALSVADDGYPWTVAAMGGPARIASLGRLLKELHSAGISMVIITKGYVGSAKQCLSDAGMLQYFDHFHGNTGETYGSDPADRSLPRHEFEGTSAESLQTPKAEVISTYLRARGLQHNEAAFVDDDDREIRSASGHCRVLHVKGSGAAAREFRELRYLCGIPSPGSPGVGLREQRNRGRSSLIIQSKQPQTKGGLPSASIADSIM